MFQLKPVLQRLLLSSSLAVSLAMPWAAQAEPTTFFVPFSGAGNVSVFDATAGTGGWVGSIDQVAPPVVADPLSLVSFVLFTLDANTLQLMGSFEFTTTDLLSTLYGEVSGMADNADILSQGGLFSLDYRILGGNGAFEGASGFGLGFVSFNPAASFDNYAETGLLNFAVPEPGSVVLVGAGLFAVAWRRRRSV
jgi:hypothetical protein